MHGKAKKKKSNIDKHAHCSRWKDREDCYDPANYARDVSKRYEADNEDGLKLDEIDTTNFAQANGASIWRKWQHTE